MSYIRGCIVRMVLLNVISIYTVQGLELTKVNGIRATEELALDVLRDKITNIRNSLANISFSNFDVIESEIEVIDSKVDLLGACSATPITQSGTVPGSPILIQTAGIVIDSPGHYCLAQDLDIAGVEAWAITINADHVTLDLNGKTIFGDLNSSGAVAILGSDVVIKNGFTVTAGIGADSCESIVVSNCVFNNDSFISWTSVTDGVIENCVFSESFSGIGFNLCSKCLINNCNFIRISGSSIIASQNGNNNIVQNCVLEVLSGVGTSDTAGIRFSGSESNSSIINCTINNVTTNSPSFNQSYGVQLQLLTGFITASTTTPTISDPLSIEWSFDSHYLAVGSVINAATELNVYVLTDVGALQLLPNAAVEFGATVSVVTWSPDGRYLAAISGGIIHVYSFINETLSAVTTFDPGATANAISWSPDGNYILVGTVNPNTEEIQVLAFGGATLTLVAQTASADNVTSVDWDSTGRFFAASAGDHFNTYSFNGTTITLVDTATRASAGFNMIRWSPTSNYIAAATVEAGGAIIAYPSANGVLGTPIVGTSAGFGTAVAWAPDGQYLVTAVSNGTVTYFLSLLGLTIVETEASVPVCVDWSPNGHKVSCGDVTSNLVRTYDAQFSGATGCIVKDCTINRITGGSGTSVGIAASSDDNLIIGNIVSGADIGYVGITNAYVNGYFGTPTLIQNITVPPL